ncbi:AraC family transcriptional regulator [Pontibacter diazotrophicus]|uniref:AraC family transcriptional regulator n=1 Tax=Pontibacter diazotrophicus TaxID=1400979 RepID=A0A3D8LET1_9BACT|nr:AraC family transcriptional regulator [Pontibacter diazotrophicus]RDV15908.1 AraC family transcriptional regulator [Pontibacter diazotrophicus]
MDKILSENWANIFSLKEQRMVYQGTRYAEAESILQEPGLATFKINTVTTPGIVLNRMDLTCEQKLHMVDDQVAESLQAVFLLKGELESRFSTLSKPVNILQKSHSLQYNTCFQGEHIIQAGRFDVYNLIFDLEFFKNIVQDTASGPMDALANKVEKKESFLVTPALLEVQPRMVEIIQTLQHNPFQGLTRYIYIEAKLLELFALQMEHIALTGQSAKQDQILLPDREKLKAVRDFIEENYLLPLRLSDLSRQFGLNDFKLKKGYKQLFCTTVFGHIQQLRMQRAKQLLSEKQMNVSEVALFIGYNNIGSFSAEFKKQFGYSPSKI